MLPTILRLANLGGIAAFPVPEGKDALACSSVLLCYCFIANLIGDNCCLHCIGDRGFAATLESCDNCAPWDCRACTFDISLRV